MASFRLPNFLKIIKLPINLHHLWDQAIFFEINDKNLGLENKTLIYELRTKTCYAKNWIYRLL